eukprot:3448547-Alexandrium_andersonii.AAC.1
MFGVASKAGFGNFRAPWKSGAQTPRLNGQPPELITSESERLQGPRSEVMKGPGPMNAEPRGSSPQGAQP